MNHGLPTHLRVGSLADRWGGTPLCTTTQYHYTSVFHPGASCDPWQHHWAHSACNRIYTRRELELAVPACCCSAERPAVSHLQPDCLTAVSSLPMRPRVPEGAQGFEAARGQTPAWWRLTVRRQRPATAPSHVSTQPSRRRRAALQQEPLPRLPGPLGPALPRPAPSRPARPCLALPAALAFGSQTAASRRTIDCAVVLFPPDCAA